MNIRSKAFHLGRQSERGDKVAPGGNQAHGQLFDKPALEVRNIGHQPYFREIFMMIMTSTEFTEAMAAACYGGRDTCYRHNGHHG
ncbi:hypothetical protein EUGRSUZ_D00404 [Eucalyptus grandis]|uniref:Uncharacterized protein n=1 Tax=Eucalyptus grandis TaxID=71139 RepID=A0A059CCR9_EUCGR|nr:hypothetical protein EUGRSUZ_D00404 [Eucalyptus grandis]